MKKMLFALMLLPSLLFAQAPQPIIIDSQSRTVADQQVYQASKRTFRLYFRDGGVATVLSTNTSQPFMNWATNKTSSSVYTSSYVFVSSVSGIVDCTFSALSLNTNGNFIYEAGLKDQPLTYRQGNFTILASPSMVGTNVANSSTTVNWDLLSNVGTVPWSTTGGDVFKGTPNAFTATNSASASWYFTAPIYLNTTNIGAWIQSAWMRINTNDSNIAIALTNWNARVAAAEGEIDTLQTNIVTMTPLAEFYASNAVAGTVWVARVSSAEGSISWLTTNIVTMTPLSTLYATNALTYDNLTNAAVRMGESRDVYVTNIFATEKMVSPRYRVGYPSFQFSFAYANDAATNLPNNNAVIETGYGGTNPASQYATRLNAAGWSYLEAYATNGWGLFKLFNASLDVQGTGSVNAAAFTQNGTNMVRDGGSGYVLNLATGTTIADAIQTNEPVSLAQLNDAIGGISVFYASTNRTFDALLGGSNLFYDARTFVPTHTNSVIMQTGITNGQYLAQWISNTNLITNFREGFAIISGRMKLTSTAGKSATVKPEIYIWYADGTMPELFETSQSVALTTTMTDYITSIATTNVPTIPSTARAVVKWKCVSQTGNPEWQFECGTSSVVAVRMPVANPLVVNAVDTVARTAATNNTLDIVLARGNATTNPMLQNINAGSGYSNVLDFGLSAYSGGAVTVGRKNGGGAELYHVSLVNQGRATSGFFSNAVGTVKIANDSGAMIQLTGGGITQDGTAFVSNNASGLSLAGTWTGSATSAGTAGNSTNLNGEAASFYRLDNNMTNAPFNTVGLGVMWKGTNYNGSNGIFFSNGTTNYIITVP